MSIKLVMDNGGSTIKCGYAGDENPKMYFYRNIRISDLLNATAYVTKTLFHLVADEINTKVKQKSQLRFHLPFERGYLTNFDECEIIWKRLFSPDLLNVNCQDTSLFMTEPLFNFRSIQEKTAEMVFEKFGFQSFATSPACLLAAYYHNCHFQKPPSCCLIIDSGFSFTHIIPIINGKIYKSGIKRIDIGGKLLTNYLKDVITYRYFNMQDDTYEINRIKEELCYVSLDYKKDFQISQSVGRNNQIVKNYVLPNYTTIKEGILQEKIPKEIRETIKREDIQILSLKNERFIVPELLFTPNDVGINQKGICESIVDSLNTIPSYIHPLLLDNIVLCGGNTLFPNFKLRLEKDLRCLINEDYNINVYQYEQSQYTTFRGMSLYTKRYNDIVNFVTKDEYRDSGINLMYSNEDDFDC